MQKMAGLAFFEYLLFVGVHFDRSYANQSFVLLL
jgi:hypothetical protein